MLKFGPCKRPAERRCDRLVARDRQSEERDDDGKITKRAAKPAEINRELAALRRSFNLAVQAEKLLRKRLSAKDGGVLPEAAIG